jgi:hypothetical protein
VGDVVQGNVYRHILFIATGAAYMKMQLGQQLLARHAPGIRMSRGSVFALKGEKRRLGTPAL